MFRITRPPNYWALFPYTNTKFSPQLNVLLLLTIGFNQRRNCFSAGDVTTENMPTILFTHGRDENFLKLRVKPLPRTLGLKTKTAAEAAITNSNTTNIFCCTFVRTIPLLRVLPRSILAKESFSLEISISEWPLFARCRFLWLGNDSDGRFSFGIILWQKELELNAKKVEAVSYRWNFKPSKLQAIIIYFQKKRR